MLRAPCVVESHEETRGRFAGSMVNVDSSHLGSASGNRQRVLLHSIAGAPGTQLARRLGSTAAWYGRLRPLVGPFPRPIARLSGPETLLEEAADSLPDGAARPEAVAVRLRRAGIALAWGSPDILSDARSFIQLCHERGASSVELVRADPSLLSEMQLGAFFQAYWRRRVLRHALSWPALAGALLRVPAAALGLAADLAFWAGVRSAASARELERFTRSSYVVFYYHRIGADGWRGHEDLDLHSRRFERQLRLLKLLRFRPLRPAELLSFHNDPDATLPRRSYVLTADDALHDAVVAFRRIAHLHPHVFVNTAAVGGSPWWTFGKDVAGWDELREFEAAGGLIASHCRGHPRLPTLDPDALRDELAGSLEDLRMQFRHPLPLLAYPHGYHDERVRTAVAAVGYRAAFTTEPGVNGAGTDVYCLRRLAIKDWDGYAALLWKVVTGELLPRRWHKLRLRVHRAKCLRRPSRLR
jgi:peptidoglycan/xylan/chitin deacetylase (PgdA/CDA1 family)